MVIPGGLTIFIEGGHKGMLAAQARQMFTKFLQEKCLFSVRPRVTFCGSRNAAFERFKVAKKAGANCLLLVDSEEVADPDIPPWKQKRIVEIDGWTRPTNATDRDLHFMASTMETWLVACDVALRAFFGAGFKTAKLPKSINLERVSKGDVHAALLAATRGSDKGEYAKGPHSFKVLAEMDPERIRARCPNWAGRFCEELTARGMK